MTTNPYAPPVADCTDPTTSDRLLQELKSQNTWRLLGFGLITIGTYYAHYCARQSRVINRHSDSEAIPRALVFSLYVLAYSSLALFFGYLLADETHPVAIASNVADKLWMLLMIVWGFYARGALNKLMFFSEADPKRVKGLWTLLFTPLHFNYKINVLNEAPSGTQVVA